MSEVVGVFFVIFHSILTDASWRSTNSQRMSFAPETAGGLESNRCLRCPLSSRGGVSSACSGNWATPPRRERPVQQERLQTRIASLKSSQCTNLTPDRTSAQRCCESIFRNFSSMKMSSCICSKTARSDAQTTARGHPDLACENTAHAMKRLADSLD